MKELINSGVVQPAMLQAVLGMGVVVLLLSCIGCLAAWTNNDGIDKVRIDKEEGAQTGAVVRGQWGRPGPR